MYGILKYHKMSETVSILSIFLANYSKNNHDFIIKMVQIHLSMRVKQKNIDKMVKNSR